MYIITITNAENLYNGVNVAGVAAEVPAVLEAFNVHVNEAKKSAWFRVLNIAAANLVAEHLAAQFPGSEVLVSEVRYVFQSERPKVNKKSASERGVLPA